MKKKVKLITTIASLGLALALMAFGVYAAVTASFSVTTQVSFQATAHVKATVTVTETAALAAAPQASDYANSAATGLTDGKMSITRSSTGQDTNGLVDLTLAEVKLREDATYYSYKVVIHNDDAENSLTVTATTATQTGTGYTVTFDKNGNDNSIAAGEDYTFVCTIKIDKLDGNAVNVVNADLGVSFKLDAVLA